MFTIYWYHFGATNTLTTEEFDTVIDFLDLLQGEERELTRIIHTDESYTVEEFIAINKGA